MLLLVNIHAKLPLRTRMLLGSWARCQITSFRCHTILMKLFMSTNTNEIMSWMNVDCSLISCYLAKRLIKEKLEMWVNAQRDGRPAEYRWRPLFNAAKSGWRPLLKCRAVTLWRRKTRWNLQGCLKLANRSQLLLGRSSPYCENMWGRHCCLTGFLPIVDTCLSCKDIARQSCAMVPRMRFFGSCICSEPRAAHFRPISKFALGPYHV